VAEGSLATCSLVPNGDRDLCNSLTISCNYCLEDLLNRNLFHALIFLADALPIVQSVYTWTTCEVSKNHCVSRRGGRKQRWRFGTEQCYDVDRRQHCKMRRSAVICH